MKTPLKVPLPKQKRKLETKQQHKTKTPKSKRGLLTID